MVALLGPLVVPHGLSRQSMKSLFFKHHFLVIAVDELENNSRPTPGSKDQMLVGLGNLKKCCNLAHQLVVWVEQEVAFALRDNVHGNWTAYVVDMLQAMAIEVYRTYDGLSAAFHELRMLIDPNVAVNVFADN